MAADAPKGRIGRGDRKVVRETKSIPHGWVVVWFALLVHMCGVSRAMFFCALNLLYAAFAMLYHGSRSKSDVL